MTAEVISATTTTTEKKEEEVVVVVEKTIEAETEEKKTEEAVAAELEKELAASVSFKEETNVVSELPETHKKALDDLKSLVLDALNKRELSAPPPKEEKPVVVEVAEKVDEEEKEVVVKAEEETTTTTTTPVVVEESGDVVVAEPKKSGIWGIPKVTFPWGRKSVTEAPKEEDVTVTEDVPEPVTTEAASATEPASVTVTEEIKEEIVTAPPVVVEETKEEVTVPEVVVTEEPAPKEEEVKEEEPAAAASSASAVEKPKKKKIFSIPKVSLNWGFSKKEPKKEEEVTEEPKEEVTVPEVTKEEVTVPEVTEEAKEEVTVPVPEEPKEEVTVPVPEVTEEPKEEVTVTAPDEEVKEEITAPVPEVTAPETEAVEEPKDKEVISEEEPEKAVEEITAPAPEVTAPLEPEEVSIWGVTLLADEKSDVILLKFLRARDFKVKEAFAMLRNTVRWQKEFKIDTLLEEDLGTDLEKVVYINGVDKEGHPVCYNVYGEFQNKELYQSTFADVEKPEKFLRWRVQFLEKTIRKDLDFSPNGVSTFVQVNDLKASPGPLKRELRVATDQALQLFQDNYPEFVAKQVFINVPWYYLAYYKVRSPFFTQRTKSKFVVAGPSKTTETLFKYIAPEQVPVQYGGLKLEGEQEFTTTETATEEIVKPSTKTTIEIPCSEASTLVWESRVIGWDVLYGAEFVPSAEGGYTVIIQKLNKIAPVDETVLSGSYKASEAGKVVLTFDNSASSKKKKLLYRSKAKPSE